MNIVLTTDGSVASENAIRWFCQLPIHDNKACPVVTVASNASYGVLPGPIRDEFYELENRHSVEYFQRAATIMKGFGLEAIHVPRTGQAADQITQYAKECDADLVIVSAQGAGILTRLFLGSTSETVATHASCSVLVVRGADRPESLATHPIHVTLALDGTEDPIETASQIRELGLPLNTKISLVSIIEHPPLLDLQEQYDTQLVATTTTGLETLAEQLKPALPMIETYVLEKVHIGEGIERFVKENKTDIVVVRDKGRSAISRFLLGSVSRFVLRHAECSVLVLKKRS